MNQRINQLRNEMRSELENNILPFWMNKMEDNEQGGFYGEITGDDELRPEASKGAILNARILWTFSAAYRLLKKPEYLKTATRAKRYLIDRFPERICPRHRRCRSLGICPTALRRHRTA